MQQFELFTGQQFRAGPERVGEDDLVRGVGASAVALSLWRTTEVAVYHVVNHVEERWVFKQDVPSSMDAFLEATVVRLEEGDSPDVRVATFYRELLTADRQVVQSGLLTAVVRGVSVVQSQHRDVGTIAWGCLLRDALAESSAFTAAVASWDGTIGLRGGHREVHLRVYRGRIIDVIERSPRGATFTLGASDLVWTRFLTAPNMRFSARLLAGDFTSSGDPYEYLRLSKAVEIIVETARVLATPDTPQRRTA